jgi:hypothetical protein
MGKTFTYQKHAQIQVCVLSAQQGFHCVYCKQALLATAAKASNY